tara:strand:+ start:226 stop:1245 length:1020 start_codon:yes stop_codon:yes gene_type:complete
MGNIYPLLIILFLFKLNIHNKITIKAEKKFVIKWNRAFAKTFSWRIKDYHIISRNYWLGKRDFIAPWHPLFYFPEKNNLFNPLYKPIDKEEEFALFFFPEKSFSLEEKENLLKKNQLIHYIHLENKSILDLYKSLKSRTRSYINSGLNQFTFIKVSSYEGLKEYEQSLKNIFIEQYLKFMSPCPPFELLKNLLIENAIDIYLAIQENKLVGFATLSRDKYITHILWIFKSDMCKSNSLSLCLYYICIEESIRRKAKLISLGTTISLRVAKFKEKLSAERGILFKYKLSSISSYKKLFALRSRRKILNLTIMQLILRIFKMIFGLKGFENISKEIWKRFD